MSAPRPEVAVVLASHGDRGGADRNDLLLAHADAVRALAKFRIVAAGVLKGEPSLESALAGADVDGTSEILVYPLLMSDGYFATTLLPDRIRATGLRAQVRLLSPLGLDPGLPAQMHDEAIAASKRARVDPSTSQLLVVGHGSKFGPASAAATRTAADRISRASLFAGVTTAFLEEPPFLESALRESQRPTVVCGFFYGDGMHAGEDIPAAIEAAGAEAHYAGPAGRAPRLPDLIAAALLSASANNRL